MGTLLLKAEHNRRAAFLAESKNHYDAAVSRYYYEIFQKIRAISDEYEIPKVDVNEKNFHFNTIKNFIDGAYKIEKKLPDEVTYWISKIDKLRLQRNASDYNDNEQIEDAATYNMDFKKYYIQINKALEHILKKKKGKGTCA
jgi:hypothetical protein